MSEKGLVGGFSMNKKLVKSKRRIKDQGEVYTPEWLTKECVGKIKLESHIKDKTVCDPACGNCNLLVEIIKVKIEEGSTPLEALQTTYGVDIMQDNVWECRRRLFEIAYSYDKKPTKEWKTALLTNIRCANTLEKSLEEIFTAPLDEVDTCPQV